MAPTPTAAFSSPSSTRRGPRNTARTVRATSPGTVARSTSASPSSWAPTGSGRGSHCCPGRRGRRGLGRGVEQHDHDVDPDTPSTSAWWVFDEQCEATVLEALDEPHLPQRLVAVERLREDAAGEGRQLLLGAGRGQSGGAHVVARGSGAGRRPSAGGPGPAARTRAAGGSAAPAAAGARSPRAARRRGRVALEQHHRRHVHVRGGVLDMQERGVERAQAVSGDGGLLGQCGRNKHRSAAWQP